MTTTSRRAVPAARPVRIARESPRLGCNPPAAAWLIARYERDAALLRKSGTDPDSLSAKEQARLQQLAGPGEPGREKPGAGYERVSVPFGTVPGEKPVPG
jgi:hypothetical protein